MKGQLFVISAPSGGGKSTIIGALRDRIEGLGYSVSHTSRVPRDSEKNGVDYCFVDRSSFKRMIEEGALVEWAEVYGEYYGTSFSSLEGQTDLGLDVLLDLDIQGAKNIRNRFPDSILIYLLPPSLEILRKRLVDRGTDGEELIRMRLRKASREIRNCLWYDYIVINDDLEKAVCEVESIILAQRCRTERKTCTVKELYEFPSP